MDHSLISVRGIVFCSVSGHPLSLYLEQAVGVAGLESQQGLGRPQVGPQRLLPVLQPGGAAGGGPAVRLPGQGQRQRQRGSGGHAGVPVEEDEVAPQTHHVPWLQGGLAVQGQTVVCDGPSSEGPHQSCGQSRRSARRHEPNFICITLS